MICSGFGSIILTRAKLWVRHQLVFRTHTTSLLMYSSRTRLRLTMYRTPKRICRCNRTRCEQHIYLTSDWCNVARTETNLAAREWPERGKLDRRWGTWLRSRRRGSRPGRPAAPCRPRSWCSPSPRPGTHPPCTPKPTLRPSRIEPEFEIFQPREGGEKTSLR
jgi:hypothetical protein